MKEIYTTMFVYKHLKVFWIEIDLDCFKHIRKFFGIMRPVRAVCTCNYVYYLCYNYVKGRYVMSTTDHMIFLVYCRFIHLYIIIYKVVILALTIYSLYIVNAFCTLFHELVLLNLLSVFTILTIIMKRYATIVGKKNWWPGTDIGKKLMTWHRYWEKIDDLVQILGKNW